MGSERYVFEVPGRKEYIVEQPLETIKRRLRPVTNGLVSLSLETITTIIKTDFGGIELPVLVGEGLHHRVPVYHFPIEYEVNGKPMKDKVDVYEVS
jgi:hypothetical protein